MEVERIEWRGLRSCPQNWTKNSIWSFKPETSWKHVPSKALRPLWFFVPVPVSAQEIQKKPLQSPLLVNPWGNFHCPGMVNPFQSCMLGTSHVEHQICKYRHAAVEAPGAWKNANFCLKQLPKTCGGPVESERDKTVCYQNLQATKSQEKHEKTTNFLIWVYTVFLFVSWKTTCNILQQTKFSSRSQFGGRPEKSTRRSVGRPWKQTLLTMYF